MRGCSIRSVIGDVDRLALGEGVGGSRMIWSPAVKAGGDFERGAVVVADGDGLKVPRPLLTTPTRRPSARKRSALAGTESCVCCCGSLKWTKT